MPGKRSNLPKLDLEALYAHDLPISPCPALPTIYPHNPLSVLWFLWRYFVPARGPRQIFHGKIDRAAGCVSVTALDDMAALWYRGFFGKGTLSRSEPTWYVRTRRKHGLIAPDEQLAAEEITERRRAERKIFKEERARRERKLLEETLRREGRDDEIARLPALPRLAEAPEAPRAKLAQNDIPQLETLQLSPQEALFLAVFVGCLEVDGLAEATMPPLPSPLSPSRHILHVLMNLRSQRDTTIQSDCKFLVKYVAYHHFRSLGWVVRDGAKFGVDYLLYRRGPVFAHADFAVVVSPAYACDDPRSDDIEKRASYARASDAWHTLYAVNRVQAHAKKTLVRCYVLVPTNESFTRALSDGRTSVPDLLSMYSVREFTFKRWVASRT